jgi:hypothetical protein
MLSDPGTPGVLGGGGASRRRLGELGGGKAGMRPSRLRKAILISVIMALI